MKNAHKIAWINIFFAIGFQCGLLICILQNRKYFLYGIPSRRKGKPVTPPSYQAKQPIMAKKGMDVSLVTIIVKKKMSSVVPVIPIDYYRESRAYDQAPQGPMDKYP